MARGPKMYSKHTHSKLCLNSSSHHHPSNKHSILSALVNRARTLYDQDNIREVLVFLEDIFRQNGCTG
jgi:hypothetical protein